MVVPLDAGLAFVDAGLVVFVVDLDLAFAAAAFAAVCRRGWVLDPLGHAEQTSLLSIVLCTGRLLCRRFLRRSSLLGSCGCLLRGANGFLRGGGLVRRCLVLA